MVAALGHTTEREGGMHPKVQAIFACEGAPPAARVAPPALEVVAALGGGHTTDRSGGEGGGGGSQRPMLTAGSSLAGLELV